MRSCDEIILKNTLVLIKETLNKMKTYNSNSNNAKCWKFPNDITNVFLNSENIGLMASKNLKMRTKIFEILTLISFQVTTTNKSDCCIILENFIKIIYNMSINNFISQINFKFNKKKDQENLIKIFRDNIGVLNVLNDSKNFKIFIKFR